MKKSSIDFKANSIEFFRNNQPNKAIDRLQKAYEKTQGDNEINIMLFCAYMAANNFQKAKQLFKDCNIEQIFPQITMSSFLEK